MHRLAFICVCIAALATLTRAQTPEHLLTRQKAPVPAGAHIPPSSTWPWPVAAYMATCGSAWFENGTTPLCPHALAHNDTVLTPGWPAPHPNRTVQASVRDMLRGGLEHIDDDSIAVLENVPGLRVLLAVTMLHCEQFYVQWILNATGGRYPPARGDWDPRCACIDAVDYMIASGVMRHYTQGYQTPTRNYATLDEVPFHSPMWLNLTSEPASSPLLRHMVDFSQSRNYTPRGVPRKSIYRYTHEPIECRVPYTPQPYVNSQWHNPQRSTRTPYDACAVDRNFETGERLVWGTEAYVACSQRDVWEWFWRIPPVTVAERPAEYALLRLTAPSSTHHGTGSPTPVPPSGNGSSGGSGQRPVGMPSFGETVASAGVRLCATCTVIVTTALLAVRALV